MTREPDRAARLRWPLSAMALLLASIGLSYVGGVDSYVRINDHLDGFVPLYRLLVQEHAWIGSLDERIDAIFGGLPRNSMPSTLNLGVLFYYVLEPIAAHIANEILMRLVAFVGMFVLLRRHLLREAGEPLITGVSLCFALLPFLPAGYLSVAGQPLLLHAILELRARRGSFGGWCIVVVFAVYSSLVYVGLYILLLLGLLVFHDWIRERRLNGRLVAAGLMLGLLYAGSEYRVLFQTAFDPAYVSHRSEFVRTQGGLLHLVRASLRTFFLHHRHAGSLQSPFVLLTITLALALGVAAARLRAASWSLPALGPAVRAELEKASRWRALVVVVGLCAGIALLVGLWEWAPLQALVESRLLGPLRMFNFQRVQWFQPLLLALAFAYALFEIARRLPRLRFLALGLLGAQALWLVFHGHALTVRRDEGLTFREYYSPALFAEIRDHIGRDQSSYRVVSFGMTPAPALYNGFQVLDGFVNDYPTEYKRRLRRVMAAELAKAPFLAGHFDRWGGHADLLSSELGRVSGYGKTLYTKTAPRRSVGELAFDPQGLRELGADYVLSAVDIENHEALGLRRAGVFEREDSPWRIALYAVSAAPDAPGAPE